MIRSLFRNIISTQPQIVVELNRVSNTEYKVVGVSGNTSGLTLEFEDDLNSNTVVTKTNITLPFLIDIVAEGYQITDKIRVRVNGGEWINDYGLRLNGRSVIVDNQQSQISPTNQWTEEVWFKFDGYDAYDTICGFAGNNFDARVDNNSRIRAHRKITRDNGVTNNTTSFTENPFANGIDIYDGNVHYWGVSMNGDTGKVIMTVDGIILENTTITPFLLSAQTNNFHVGGAGATSRILDGIILSARVWHVAKTLSEMQTIRKETNLNGALFHHCYKMDGMDRSGNNNNGIINQQSQFERV